MKTLNLRILERALAQPWAMRFENLTLLTQMILAGDMQPKKEATAKPVKAQAGYTVLNFEGACAVMDETLPSVGPDVHVILAWGILGRAWTAGEKWWFDAIEVDDIARAVAAAPEDSTVAIWFRSPGGIITGIPETAALLSKAAETRRVVAFTDELCASAAYWLASQCQEIHATPTADLGSIGVYLAFYDFCKYLENEGIKLELFKAGRLKATGLPGNPLDEEARANLQQGVDEAFAMFTRDVLAHRELDSDTMQGQTFDGPKAKKLNLCDRNNWPSAAEFLARL